MATQQIIALRGQDVLSPGTTEHAVQQLAVYPIQPYDQQQQPVSFPTPANAREQPQAIIIMQPTYTSSTHREAVYQIYRGKSANIMGWLQLTAGMVSVILGLAGTLAKANSPQSYNFTHGIAPGIWCGSIVSIMLSQRFPTWHVMALKLLLIASSFCFGPVAVFFTHVE